MRESRAFTLIELLVAIVIIAVMAAILFPVFSTVRRSSHTTQCVSNLHQVYVAIAAYAQDHDDYLPPYQNSLVGFGSTGNPYIKVDNAPEKLVEVLQPYAKSTAIFFCPEDLSAHKVSHQFTSYMTNNCISKGIGLRRWVSLSGSSLCLYNPEDTGNPADRYLLSEDFLDTITWDGPPKYMHNQLLNFVFFDGHVKGVPWKNIPH